VTDGAHSYLFYRGLLVIKTSRYGTCTTGIILLAAAPLTCFKICAYEERRRNNGPVNPALSQ
jgi:hypothetical protein